MPPDQTNSLGYHVKSAAETFARTANESEIVSDELPPSNESGVGDALNLERMQFAETRP